MHYIRKALHPLLVCSATQNGNTDIVEELCKKVRYTSKNVQVSTSLLQACCYLAVSKPISGCVRIACSGLMITVASCQQAWCKLVVKTCFVHKLDASCFSKSENVKLH